MITKEDIQAAAARINGHVRRTPVMTVAGAEFGLGHDLDLKLELFHPYDNDHNMFQQVALISVSCIGMQLEVPGQNATSEEQPLPLYLQEDSAISLTRQKYGLPSQIGKSISPEELTTFDRRISSKIVEMQQQREQANHSDDLDQHTKLKDQIEFLVEKAREIRKLKEVKQMAVEQEDYEVAKRLKDRIYHHMATLAQKFKIDFEEAS